MSEWMRSGPVHCTSTHPHHPLSTFDSISNVLHASTFSVSNCGKWDFFGDLQMLNCILTGQEPNIWNMDVDKRKQTGRAHLLLNLKWHFGFCSKCGDLTVLAVADVIFQFAIAH